MKKLKIGSILLASALLSGGLVGCNNNPADNPPIITPEVKNVSLDDTNLNLFVGDTHTLIATVNVMGGASKDLEWKSSDESIITILSLTDNSCTFSCLKEGIAFVTATSKNDSNKFAKAQVNVKTAKILSVTATNHNVTACSNAELNLYATVEKEGPASTDLKWTSNDTSIVEIVKEESASCRIRGLKKGTTTIKVESKIDSSKYDTINVTIYDPEILNFYAEETSLEMEVNDIEELSFTLTTKGQADNLSKINYFVEDSSVVEIVNESENSVRVKALKEGSTVLTAKSDFDPSKIVNVEIRVIDKGFAPYFYESGYEYIKSGLNDKIESYLNVDNVYIPSFTYLGNTSVYAKEITDDEYNPDSYQIVVDFDFENVNAESNFNAYINEIFTASGFDLYEDYYLLIESNGKYAIMLSNVYDTNWNEYIALNYIKITDLFQGSSTLTTDTDWNSELKAEMISAFGEIIPFVALGEDYDARVFEDEDYGLVFGAIDYAYLPNALANYDEILIGQGFTYVETDYAYEKPIDDLTSLWVQFDFEIGFGNVIQAFYSTRTYDEFPTELLNNYVQNVIGSKYSAIPFETSEATYEEGFTMPASYRAYEYEESDTMPACFAVSGLYYTESEFDTYINQYVDDGFVITNQDGDDSFKYCDLEKGKLGVRLELYGEFDDYTWEYNFDHSTVYLNVYQVEGFEDQGLWVKSDTLTLKEGSSEAIEYFAVDLGENPEISFTSSDSSIATVDENGVVTGVKMGETTITLECNYGGFIYTATKIVKVLEGAKTYTISANDFENTDATALTSYNVNGISFVFSKGEGSAEPKYYDKGSSARCYSGNTLTVTAKDGYVINSITFNDVTGKNEDPVGGIDVNKGYYDEDTTTWTGDKNSVTFTVLNGQFRFKSITIAVDTGEEGGDMPELDADLVSIGESLFDSYFGYCPLTYCDYDDEEADGDMYYHLDSSLEFLGFADSGYFEDDSQTLSQVYDYIVSCLPEGATLDLDYGENIEDNFCYDVVYNYDDVSIAIFVVDYFGYVYGEDYAGMSYLLTVDVFYSYNLSTYIDFVNGGGGSENEELDEILDYITAQCGVDFTYDSSDGSYWGYYITSKTSLSAALDEGVANLPSYLVEIEPADIYNDDDEDYGVAIYATEDDNIYIYIYTYVDSKGMNIEYDVYDFSGYDY